MTEKQTEMEKEYGMLPAKLRAKNKKGMLSKSLQETRMLEALARGEKIPNINSKLSAKQFQSIKKVQRGKDYKGRGDVPTEKQVKERAKISNVPLPISKPKIIKKAHGGSMCRGMGAATKGGQFGKNG